MSQPQVSQTAQIAAAAIDRLVADVADFPQPGVNFKDITPLLSDHDAFAATVAALAEAGTALGPIDVVVGMEARGFILGAPVALALGVGFVPVRKAGKLPRQCHSVSYALEYAEATVQVHRDAISPGQRVLLVDDVLATGGTLGAAQQLVEACGGVAVGAALLLEICALGGRAAVGPLPMTILRQI